MFYFCSHVYVLFLASSPPNPNAQYMPLLLHSPSAPLVTSFCSTNPLDNRNDTEIEPSHIDFGQPQRSSTSSYSSILTDHDEGTIYTTKNTQTHLFSNMKKKTPHITWFLFISRG